MSENPLWERYQTQLDALSSAKLNFDLEHTHDYTAANGWHVDDHSAELPAEPPGPPVTHGSWEVARQLMQEYKFPDPDILTGIYYPDRPLEERVMLLRAKFLFFTFYFGVRVGNVVDEVRDTDDGKARIWGYNYQTLEGHFERGQMNFEVWKWLETGKVEFRIHAFSQPGQIENPIYRLGFKLFGRRVQLKFVHNALKRMQRLVAAELQAEATDQPRPEVEAPEVKPASEKEGASDKLDEAAEKASES